jgi:hypothetical protein
LENIQSSIESLYVNGQPLHHLSSAREVNYDPLDSQQSCIFVVPFDDFTKMSAMTLQGIFKDRHILVVGAPASEQPFGLESLLTLGPLKRVIQIQG